MEQGLLGNDKEEQVLCACCSSSRLKSSGFCLSILGVALLLVSVFIPPFIHTKLNDGINDYINLGPDAMESQTQGFRTWANGADTDAVPLYQTVYIYNIENPDEILASPTTRPNVTQYGPYVYQEVKLRFDFEYGQDYDNRNTLRFREWIYWVYQPSMSAPGLNPDTDVYTTFNVPFQAVLSGLRTANQLKDWLAIDLLCGKAYPDDKSKLFQSQRTVSELLFGYADCITNFIPADGLSKKGYFPGLLGANLMPNENNTYASVRNFTLFDEIFTGTDDSDYLRQYNSWKEQNYLSGGVSTPTGAVEYDLWGSPLANRVYGTDGAQFKRNLAENSTVNCYVSELMRHVPLTNVGGQHVNDLHGIDLLRYTLDPKILLNATQYPQNADYYQFHINGVLNVSLTKQGLPIFMSKPHFLDADDFLREDIIGMNPNRDLHETTLDVEPLTGATMRAHKRLQINFRTAPFAFNVSITIFNNTIVIPTSWYPNIGVHYLPVGWLEESAEITRSKASDFKSQVYGAQDAEKYIHLLGSIIGSVCVAISISMFFSAVSRSQKFEAPVSPGINDRY